MSTPTLHPLRGTAVAASALLALTACAVQGVEGEGGDFPSGPIEMTTPTTAGGSGDLITRALAQDLEEPLGTTVNVVNRAGANGKIAAEEVFARDPDGQSLAVMMQSLFAITPLAVEDPDAVDLDDMTLIRGLALEGYVLVAPEDSDYETLDDLLEADRVTYGTAGAGTGGQLAQAALFGLAGTEAEDVPFDGGAPAVTAVLGGKVGVAAAHAAEVVSQVEAGELRPLAVFNEERMEAFPDVPTAAEQGYDVVVDQRRFVAAPAGLPDEVNAAIGEAVDEAVASEDFGEVLEQNHIEPWEADGEQVRTQLEDSRERYASMADDLGLELSSES